ncbi:MGDG synthase family glycosyltransferase [Paenibacillus segetis]|uniref:UDP-glucuronosyltransferase n=1 Tax=Paenibacillus segetis TaxID=1325360 RepID=A0ABQ1Y4W7_9BACL|nr:glycosyltransferase [Paenibacillus segetis]GGH12612.1 UDP-glucuronosyltransferase [Paenibacillus segetis]
MSKKRVLILSEGFGSGHTQAGYALAAGLKQICPQVHTKVLELGSFLNPTVAPWILSAYRITVNTSPSLVGLLYRKNYEKPLGRVATLALHKMFYHHAVQVVRQLKPDLIICTHPIPNTIISRLKASGLKVPLYTLITDYDAHGSWITPQVDQFLVSTLEVRDLLLKRGVKPESIQVTGIPVHPKFWNAQNKQSARRELGIKDMPTALVMGGGWGLLFKEDLINRLSAWKDNVQIVFCMGSNEKLAAKLQNHPSLRHHNITVVGYTQEISKWMDAADLLITKPGGMTCTEGLSKGLPMLFYESIPGQEEKNREYFVRRGYGEDLDSGDILDKWFERISTGTVFNEYPVNTFSLQPLYKPKRCATEVMELLHSAVQMKNQPSDIVIQRAN